MNIGTCGFYFSKDLTKVVLIRTKSKSDPDLKDHTGLLNGVGGKLDAGDLHLNHTQVREFFEETGKKTNEDDWYWFDTGNYPNWTVYFYYAVGDLRGISTQEEEEIVICDVADLESLPTISNLQYLIPNAIKLIKEEILI